jgi:phospholipase C
MRLGYRVAALIMACLGLSAWQPWHATRSSAVPATPIHHVIFLLQENHTFDNYFGTYPGADGIPPGLCIPVNPAAGRTPCVRPFHLGGQPITDLDHGVLSARAELDDGRMDGFVRAQTLRSGGGRQAMGYYDGAELPFYWNMADRYALFDHFFSSALGGSFINHVYWVAAGPGNASQSLTQAGLRAKTIFDRLQRAGVTWKFYIQHYNPAINYRTLPRLSDPNRISQAAWCPLLDIPRFLDDPALRSHIVDLSQYYSDLRRGTLPSVAYIVPSGASEHPPGSLTSGQRFVRGLVNSLMASPAWDSSAFVMAYDDWGGWYDHVRPLHRDINGDGFRVPALLVSPFARQHFVDHTPLDFTSMLKFIEQNWHLRPLSRLDATAGSINGAFDFRGPPRPPSIIPANRVSGGPPRKVVRDVVLYSLYGWGAVLCAALLVASVRSPRRRVRTASPGGERG